MKIKTDFSENNSKIIIKKNYEKISEFYIKNEITEINAPYEKGGYGIDFCNGEDIICSRGFSVMEKWTENPFYGFLTDFGEKREDTENTADYLTQYHINGIQYYDWMYDYGNLVFTDEDIYSDAWARKKEISNKILRKLIFSMHEKNIKSMAYVAIYAATPELTEKNKDWILYRKENEEYRIFDFCEKIHIVSNDEKSTWNRHLTEECKKTTDYGFDGIHLDQYGYPKENESYFLDNGVYKEYDSPKGFKYFINNLKKELKRDIVFNYVDNWPEKIQKDTDTGFVYIEPWECCNTYKDLYEMTFGVTRNTGKKLILAAYIKGGYSQSIKLADAIIAVSKGKRTEIGETGKILSGPYFPDADKADEKLLSEILNYYDYMAESEYFINMKKSSIKINAPYISQTPDIGKIWYFVKENEKYYSIDLINLKNIVNDNWREEQKEPEEINDYNLEFDFIPEKVFITDPFSSVRPLGSESYEIKDKKIIIKSLKYWLNIIIKK